MSMLSALLGAKGDAAPTPSPSGAAPNAPISSPQGAPAPTGIGAMPTGTGTTTPQNVEISSALIWLNAVKDKHPEMAKDIEGWQQSLREKGGAQPAPGSGAPPPLVPPGAPAGPPPGGGIGGPPLPPI